MKDLKNGVDLRVTIMRSSLKSVLDLQFPTMEYQLDNQTIQMSRLMEAWVDKSVSKITPKITTTCFCKIILPTHILYLDVSLKQIRTLHLGFS